MVVVVKIWRETGYNDTVTVVLTPRFTLFIQELCLYFYTVLEQKLLI